MFGNTHSALRSIDKAFCDERARIWESGIRVAGNHFCRSSMQRVGARRSHTSGIVFSTAQLFNAVKRAALDLCASLLSAGHHEPHMCTAKEVRSPQHLTKHDDAPTRGDRPWLDQVSSLPQKSQFRARPTKRFDGFRSRPVRGAFAECDRYRQFDFVIFLPCSRQNLPSLRAAGDDPTRREHVKTTLKLDENVMYVLRILAR